jgi:spore maturation protein SpmB
MKKLLTYAMSMTVLLAACSEGEPATTAPSEDPSEVSTAAPAAGEEETAFFLQVSNVVGKVEVRSNSNDAYAPAEVGQQLAEGAQIRTAEDGIVALYRDAVTLVIVDNATEAEIKTLSGTTETPITVLTVLSGAVAVEHHAGKLPEGAELKVETPEGNGSQILGSTVRVNYNPDTKIMTATCLTGTCQFVRGDQKLTLEAGQAVDVQGLQPPPGAPSEMTVDQANQFLAMGFQLCGGCPITIGEIRDGGLGQTSPPPEGLPSTETPSTETPSTEVPPTSAEVPDTEVPATQPPTEDSASDG